MHETIKLNLI